METCLKSCTPQHKWQSPLFHVNSVAHAIAVLVTSVMLLFASVAAEGVEASDPLESLNRATLDDIRSWDMGVGYGTPTKFF